MNKIKTKPNGLLKLTDAVPKFETVLQLQKISREDIAHLEPNERLQFMQYLTDKFNKTTGTDRDKLYEQIELIIGETSKKQMWESNHANINNAITVYINDYGTMPSTSIIADKTGLSRQTVHKHLQEYSRHPQYFEQLEHFRFMTSKVLAKVLKSAINGDVGAAKLYFKMMGLTDRLPGAGNTLINNQNNFIQINGTVLSQETVTQLNPEQLATIEQILSTASVQTHTQEPTEKN